MTTMTFPAISPAYGIAPETPRVEPAAAWRTAWT